MLPFDVEAVIVCDEVRIETTGKHILIGVYLGSIGVFVLPTNIELCFWIEIKPKETGKISGEMRLKNDASTMVQGRFELAVPEIKTTIINIPKVPLQIQGYGTMKLQIRSAGSTDWHSIKQIEIVPAAKLSTSGFSLPSSQSPSDASDS